MTRLRKTRQFCDTINTPVEQPMLLVTDRRHILHTHKHIQLLQDFSMRQFVNTLKILRKKFVNMLEIWENIQMHFMQSDFFWYVMMAYIKSWV